jgi:Tfp pilus assembly protein PilX
MRRTIRSRERGAALVIGLIMLVLITLMLLAALNLSTTNFRSVGNMQFREEAIAAANHAIEQIVSSPFTNDPAAAAQDIAVDLNNDTVDDYVVSIAQPQCISASQANQALLSSEPLGPSMSVSSNWNTVWDIHATVNSTSGTLNVGGAVADVHAGVRALLTQAQKNAVCP